MNGQILEREIRTPLQIAEEVFPLTEGLLPQLHMDRLDQVLTRGPHSDVERVSLQPIDRKAVDETGLENERERRSEEHTSELQSQSNLVCRLLLEKKKNK